MKYLLSLSWLLVSLSACAQIPATITKPQELTVTFRGQQYDALLVNPAYAHIHMHWQSHQKPYKSIKSLKDSLSRSTKAIFMLTNGGMFHKDNSPVGLYIEAQQELVALDTFTQRGGNFYMQPNGVFFLDEKGAHIQTTTEFRQRPLENRKHIQYATQSGPMLLSHGAIHGLFQPASHNLNLRSGVGILPNGYVVFVISQSNKTNFYDFASVFNGLFGCADALYLDGAISKMYLPQRRAKDVGGNFGVMISVTE